MEHPPAVAMVGGPMRQASSRAARRCEIFSESQAPATARVAVETRLFRYLTQHFLVNQVQFLHEVRVVRARASKLGCDPPPREGVNRHGRRRTGW